MRETLPIALQLMFGHEGGYSNRKTDSGGPTKYGITHRTLAAHRGVPSVSPEEVQSLTLSEAETIYRKSYWSQSGGDVLPKGLDYAVFDSGVTSGPNRAVKILQKVLGVTQDGWVGEITLAAARDYDGGILDLINDYCDARIAFMRGIKGPTGWSANGRGWTIRVTGIDPLGKWKPQPGVVGHALEMANGDMVVPKASPPAPEGGDSKAQPKPVSPWMNPGVVLPAAGGVLGGAGTLFSGMGPVQWAAAGAILIGAVVGVIYLTRYMKANPS